MGVISNKRKYLQKKLINKFGWTSVGKNGDAYIFRDTETENTLDRITIKMKRDSFLYHFRKNHPYQVSLELVHVDIPDPSDIKAPRKRSIVGTSLTFEEVKLLGEIVAAFEEEYNQAYNESCYGTKIEN